MIGGWTGWTVSSCFLSIAVSFNVTPLLTYVPTQCSTPSVDSLKKAMQTYARQGGTSTIFINDDGLQLLKEDERNARLEFYANHGKYTYVAFLGEYRS